MDSRAVGRRAAPRPMLSGIQQQPAAAHTCRLQDPSKDGIAIHRHAAAARGAGSGKRHAQSLRASYSPGLSWPEGGGHREAMLTSKIAIGDEGAGEPLVAPGQLLPFGLVTSLFFMWGVPNNLNDVLIRQFMKSFALNRVEAGLVQSAFYLGYFFLAIPAALIMRRTGYKTGLITGLLLFATGAALFWRSEE